MTVSEQQSYLSMEKEVRGNKNYHEKVLKTQVGACHCLPGRPMQLTSAKRKKKSVPKEVNFYVWPEKLDADVGARASKPGSLCKTNLPYVRWG